VLRTVEVYSVPRALNLLTSQSLVWAWPRLPSALNAPPRGDAAVHWAALAPVYHPAPRNPFEHSLPFSHHKGIDWAPVSFSFTDPDFPRCLKVDIDLDGSTHRTASRPLIRYIFWPVPKTVPAVYCSLHTELTLGPGFHTNFNLLRCPTWTLRF